MKSPNRSTKPASRARHEALALELSVIPTAAGREDRVQAFLDRWLHRRRKDLRWRRDGDGNLLIDVGETWRRARHVVAVSQVQHPGQQAQHMLPRPTLLAGAHRRVVADHVPSQPRAPYLRHQNDGPLT